MSEIMDDKPWLEEEDFHKKNTETSTKVMDMFDRNVTLGDKRRIAKYREALQSRIKEKGFSFEIRNWKRRFLNQSKETEKKITEMKNEAAALKKKQLEDQETIKCLENQVRQCNDQIKDLQSNVKYGEKEKAGQESLYKQQIQKLESDLASEQKRVQALRKEIKDKEQEHVEIQGKLIAAENAQKSSEKMLQEKEENGIRLEKMNSELSAQLHERELKIKAQEKQIEELKTKLEIQKVSDTSRQLTTVRKAQPTSSSYQTVPSSKIERRTPFAPLLNTSFPSVDQENTHSFGNSTSITIKSETELEIIPQNVEAISVLSNCCSNVLQFGLMNLNHLKYIVIGDECFFHVQRFTLDSLPQLRTIKIGINSFTKKLNGWEENKSRSFNISNCTSLISITIGQYSFSDYGGDFELVNLPKLESLYIGIFDKESWNFSNSSLILRDLPMLKSVILGDKTFGFSTHTVFESRYWLLHIRIDLKSLEMIKVGDNSLNGDKQDDCSLIMKGNLGLSTAK